ncbi:MAG: His/Gly/Thr/Pro-type tRNA ligase C-terminal domain-containing protein, partial [Candidatus Acidiferrales bacterium]
IIMVHGDDQGLILPPRLAPIQVVIVPIHKTDDEQKLVIEAARRIRAELVAADIRVKVDEREGSSPGFKFNDWEMRGVPLRIELGPKDIAKGSAVLARRDRPGKEGKAFVPQAGLTDAVSALLVEIQKALFDRALAFREANTFEPKDYGELKEIVEKGFAFAYWCGSAACEDKVKEDTKATLRCIPLEQKADPGRCLVCNEPAAEKAYFAKAY